MDNTRIIPVRFGKEHLVVTEYRMQYDYGQVLDFIDIPLSETFEARFSNSVSGQSVGQIGYNNQVRIPKQFFESGEPIYCYVTVHDEVTDGRTLYTTKVPIKPSSERTEEEPEPEEESIITQAITALNTAVDVTSQKALEASESAVKANNKLLDKLFENDVFKSLANYDDENKTYDIDLLYNIAKDSISKCGYFPVKIPAISFISPNEKELKFSVTDIDRLKAYIVE